MLESFGAWVCEAIREFFNTSILPRGYNASSLVILLKVPHPNTTTDFRPIRYHNLLCKWIFKLLCSRLKEVIPHSIIPNQSAFTKGRELLFNALLGQESTRGDTRKHICSRFIIKTDLKKAFDSVHRKFIIALLNSLKFLAIFVSWIKTHITTLTFALNLNGSTYG